MDSGGLRPEFQASLHYACRERYFYSMEAKADEALSKFPSDPVFRFYHALAVLHQRKTTQALRELQALHEEPKVNIAAMLGSITAHKACQQVDVDEVNSLEAKVKEIRKRANADELYYAGAFQVLQGRPDKAKEYVDRAIKNVNQNLDAMALCGWVEIGISTSGPSGAGATNNLKAAMEYFENTLKQNRKHIDANLGLAFCLESTRNFDGAVEKLNNLLAFYPNWLPALIEKMKLGLSMQDWDLSLDTANRIIANVSSSNLEAHRLKILYTLCREGDITSVVKSLSQFLALCKSAQGEPYNPDYFMENGRLFSQLASFDEEILNVALRFARYATELNPDNAEYLSSTGRILLLMKRYKDAAQEFRAATLLDKSSLSALYGLISCQLAEGNIDLAAHQLEFLRELSTSVESSSAAAELSYLAAVIARKKGQPSETILTYLNEAVEHHFSQTRKYPYNLSYLKAINPDLVVRIVREYLAFAPHEPTEAGVQAPASVRQAGLILEAVLKVFPCHRDALFISAYIKYLSGDLTPACVVLNELGKIDSSLIETHLLLAQIHLAQGNLDAMSQALDNGLSTNFKIREHPKYLYLTAHAERREPGGHEGAMKALKTLEGALNVIKSKRILEGSSGGDGPGSGGGSLLEFGLADKFMVYMDLIKLHRELGNVDAANNLMEESIVEFKGTQMEGRIGLSQAEELVEKGDIVGAIEILKAVTPDQNHFVESRVLLASVYLNYKQDQHAYTSCFVEIVNQNSSVHNLIMLGDAYMSIQEPEKALEVYEVAVTKNPKDPVLASKMGHAFVVTHQFRKAMNYYEDAIKSPDNFGLRLDLASLQCKLKNWEKGEKTVQDALAELKDPNSSAAVTGVIGGGANALSMEVSLLLVLVRIQQGAGTVSKACQTLFKAKDAQSRVLKRTLLEQPSSVGTQKATFKKICLLMGEIVEKATELESAIRAVKEGLDLCPNDSELLTALCKLYMKSGDSVLCQQTCQQLIRIKPENSEALFMMGELLYRKFDFSGASVYFQQYLDTNPCHWKSLMWYVECVRRCGAAKDAEVYLKKAADLSDPNEPGLGYCQGLYEWYNGNFNAALTKLNKARQDPVFGQRAVFLMIEIYVNPTGGILGGDAMESSGGGGDLLSLSNGAGDKTDVKELAIATAETLIKEIQIRSSEDKFKRQILDCFILLATRNKGKMEKAVQELNGLVTTEEGRDSVMLIYALATGNMLMKQTPRARNQLKRITKAMWTIEEAEYLERCWLLLADIHIQGSKYDLATDLIKKALQYNKSCAKASEYLGFIMEKEQAYADAAINYEAAWKLGSCNNPQLGYKLAFNYLKAKRYCDAIDVCHVVLKKHPTFPKIKKEILDKARANLRV